MRVLLSHSIDESPSLSGGGVADCDNRERRPRGLRGTARYALGRAHRFGARYAFGRVPLRFSQLSLMRCRGATIFCASVTSGFHLLAVVVAAVGGSTVEV